jgi:hypothetical protein
MSNRPSVKGVELDPLVAANDPTKPLLSKLLAVPALQTRYLGYVRDIADKWLDWEKLGPLARQYQSLIAEDVKTDTLEASPAGKDKFCAGICQKMCSRIPAQAEE